jgi:ABC-type phosphate transport system substrate-binding protein
MFKSHRASGDSRARLPRRHKLAIGASAAGAVVVALTMAAPAGAVTPPSNVNYSGATATGAATANNLIVGSGSATDYNMMQGLDTLFNQTPGCNITSGAVSGAPSKGSQQLNFACETSIGGTGNPTVGTTLEQVPGDSYLDNPINDVATEEPPMGSSNGIAQLELGRNQANTGIGTSFTTSNQQNVSAINYARSSRDPSGANDIQGLNFVAYARDGVVPLIWAEFDGGKSLFAKTVTNLTTTDLQDIYNGTYYDWAQLGSAKSAPIYVYSAQEGSGTQSTFKTFLGFDPSASSNKVNCTDPAAQGDKATATTYTPAGAKTPITFPASSTLTGCQGPQIIFENELSSVDANATSSTESPIATAWAGEQPVGTSAANPISDSIFFYSWGKFNLQCEGLKSETSYFDKSDSKEVVKTDADCGNLPLPSGTKLQLEEVNGFTVNPSSILSTSPSTVWPIDRYLYNVYSNGSNSNIPEATAATLNYVSEVGFLCKPQTVNGAVETSPPSSTTTADTNANDIVDPNTGLWYHDEIFNTILANGFLPITAVAGSNIADTTDGQALSNEVSGTVTHGAYSLLNSGGYGASYLGADAPGQSSNTSIPTSTTPDGFCLVSSTDGNANS